MYFEVVKNKYVLSVIKATNNGTNHLAHKMKQDSIIILNFYVDIHVLQI